MKKNLKLTLISLIVSFTILFPINTFLMIHLLNSNPNKIKPQNQNLKQKYDISKNQDIVILLSISSENENFKQDSNNHISCFKEINPYKKNKTTEKYFIVKISPHDNLILITNIPNNLVTTAKTNEGSPILEDTLEEIHKTCGINFLKNSIENLTQIEIDKTLKIDQNAIEGILKTIGEVKILSKDKQIYSILETKKFYEILNNNPKNAFYLLKNNFNEKTNLDMFFATLSNLCTTDISIYDFQSRKKGFEKMIQEKATKVVDLKIKTEKDDQNYKITKESLKELVKMYK